jgi:hypothetical protein
MKCRHTFLLAVRPMINTGARGTIALTPTAPSSAPLTNSSIFVGPSTPATCTHSSGRSTVCDRTRWKLDRDCMTNVMRESGVVFSRMITRPAESTSNVSF